MASIKSPCFLRMFLVLLAILFAVALAAAQLPTPLVPGCQYEMRALHASSSGAGSSAAIKIHDGTAITSPKQIARYAQEAGDKTIIIKGGNFSGWTFAGMKLSNICFVESDLSQSDWSEATAPGLGFIGSNVEAANMSGAKMPDILIRSSVFAGIDASGADWTSGKLDGGWDGNVEKLNLDSADLTGFRFSCGITVSDGCPMSRSGISARDAKLAFSDWSSFDLYDADMTGALLNQTVISPRQMTDFRNARAMGAIFLAGADEKVMVLPETWMTLMASALTAAQNDAPSFKCGGSLTAIEKEICGDGSLRQYDRQMAALYKKARKGRRAVVNSQKAWLERRNSCAADQYPGDCLRQAYDRRVGELIGLLGEGDWLLPGEEALFLEEVLPLDDDVVQSPSYVQLIPVLAGEARSSLWVKRAVDGSIEATGDAVGANAHLCSLQAKGLRFDPATGWYSIDAGENNVARNVPVLRYHDGRIEIYRSGKLRADEQLPSPNDGLNNALDDAANYISCGARASFPPMVKMAVPAALMDKYRRAAQAER